MTALLRLLVTICLFAAGMAQAQITYHGSGSTAFNYGPVSYIGTGNIGYGATSGNFLVDVPGGSQAGDLQVMVLLRLGNSLISAPTGWTTMESSTSLEGIANGVFYRIAPAGTADVTVNNTTNFPTGGRIMVFRKQDATNPILDSGIQLTASTVLSSSNTTNAPSLTGSANPGPLMVVMTGTVNDDCSGVNTPSPGSWTQAFFTSLGSGSTGGTLSAYYRMQTAAGNQASVSQSRSGCTADSYGTQFIIQPSGFSIAKPASTVANDVMMASVVVRPETAVVVAPSGWNQLRRVVQTNGGNNNTGGSLYTFYKIAGASEPSSYTFYVYDTTNSSDFVAGGIASFGGVNTSNPFIGETGNTTASGTSHTANGFSTTVANSMIVTSFMMLSAGSNWSAPSGMTEAVDRPSAASIPDAVGISLSMDYQTQASVGAIGNKTASSNGDADYGAATIQALRPAATVTIPGAFNAYETSTAANAITGVIKTKTANGSSYSLDVIALNTAKTAIDTTFSGAVTVQLLGMANYTGSVTLDGNGCPTGPNAITTMTSPGSPSITSGRSTIAFPAEANAWPYVKVKISYTSGSTTVTSCSNDAYAIKPNSLTVLAQDATWTTPGTANTLINTTTAGTIIHKAGQPFRLAVTAQNAASATTSNYFSSVAPAAVVSGVTAPATTLGTLTPGTFTGTGTVVSTTASYSEVGTFTATLQDQTFAQIDSGDSTADCAGYWICSNSFTVGRFVPDHFSITTFALTPSCSPSAVFVYTGAPFGLSFTLAARNAADVTTQNYLGTLLAKLDPTIAANWVVDPAGSGPLLGLGSADVSTSTKFGFTRLSVSAPSGTWSAGTSNMAATVTFARANNTAPETFYPTFTLGIAPKDSDGVTLSTFTLDADATAGAERGIVGATSMRYGRLRLFNAFGSEKATLQVPIQAQYYSGKTWVLNNADSCTSLATGNFFLVSAITTSVSAAGTLSGGNGNVTLAAPTGGATGSVDVTVNLGSSSVSQSCLASNGGSAANKAWLRAQSCATTYDRDPSARATFGIYTPETKRTIYIREMF